MALHISVSRIQGFPFKKIFRGHCDPQVVDFGGHFQFERVTYFFSCRTVVLVLSKHQCEHWFFGALRE